MIGNGSPHRHIQFAGSADPDVEVNDLRYALRLISQLSQGILKDGGGLVVTLGAEPYHDYAPSLPLIFDWIILEAFYQHFKKGKTIGSKSLDQPIVAVGLPKWQEKIPENRRKLWDWLLDSGSVRIVQVPLGLGVGGILRETQVVFGDILVLIGGGPGANHLAELYASNQKPVIPLDLQLKKIPLRLPQEAMEKPSKFFRYNPMDKAVAEYSKLSIRAHPEIQKFGIRFNHFLSNLELPKAFYIRLLNKKSEDYHVVEKFFRKVVDPVIKEIGYRRFEVGTDPSSEAFLNIEIFENLHQSPLVISDLTSLRPNCLLELGYAFGRQKKVIVTAKNGTKLPFDANSIPCYFWSSQELNQKTRKSFREFIRKNLIRQPLVTGSHIT